jgi:RNA polymerase sigma-70 factor (ECF subfamily)
MQEREFKSLFDQHYGILCAFANKYVADMEMARDIVQQVYINLWDRWDTLDHDNSLKPYLFRAVTNRCLNHLRSAKKIVHVELPADDEGVQSFLEETDFLETQELKSKISRSIENLPEKCRTIFLMSRNEEKSYREIAEALNVSVKAVEAQMTKALKLLREDLSDYLVIILITKLGYEAVLVCIG